MKPSDEVDVPLNIFLSLGTFAKQSKDTKFVMRTVTFRMLAVLALFAFVSIPTVQSRSSGLNCLEQNHQGGKSCDGGICFRAWESPKGIYTLIPN